MILRTHQVDVLETLIVAAAVADPWLISFTLREIL